MTLDIDRLVKVLGMTGSSYDAEALSALRRAQKSLEITDGKKPI